MSWKTAYRSFYYASAEEPEDIRLVPGTTALLVIDILSSPETETRPAAGIDGAAPAGRTD